MTPTETEVLEIIWKNGGRAPISKIANELGISTGYSHFICEGLERNQIIEPFEGQYKIADLGKEELRRLGRIEEEKKMARLEKPVKKARREKPAYGGSARGGKSSITELSNLSPELIKVLKRQGIRTLEDIAIISVSRLMDMIEDLELKQAADMINEARDKLKKEGKEYLWE